MKFSKILSYPLSVIFYLLFGLNLVVFHVIQWVCLKVFGYQAHKKSVDSLNWMLLRCLNLLGTRFDIKNRVNIPRNHPVIIVSNHQSLWDIPPIIWYLRKYHPKFISKQSLGRGIPSISFNLRHGGSVLIDRKNAEQATKKILRFADYLKAHKRSGVIFPEGTRGRDGVPRSFKRQGLRLLLSRMPDAYVLPLTINNSWKLQRWGNFPLGIGVKFEMIIHPPLQVADLQSEELIDRIEATINASIS